MTHAETHTDLIALQNAVRTAQARSARGHGSRQDWERVAAIDPNLAYRELRDFLRRTGNAEFEPTNPFQRQTGIPGAFIGFILGVLATAVVWMVMLELQDRLVNYPILRDIVTGGQFLAAVLVPLGLVLGVRWSRRQDNAHNKSSVTFTTPKNATFEELLDLFEQTQNVGRARVY